MPEVEAFKNKQEPEEMVKLRKELELIETQARVKSLEFRLAQVDHEKAMVADSINEAREKLAKLTEVSVDG